jgi:ADP-ribosyl-[dinitrogen reductase] hydrolase
MVSKKIMKPGIVLPTLSILERYQGCMMGLAVGDAIGTTLEFKSPGTFKPLTDMIGGGPFNLTPGQWTDDTSMALCLAESLIEKGFDAQDQMERYVRWWREGHLSSTGTCFDIGNATSTALRSFQETGNAYSGSTDPSTAGNGSLMRLAPVPLAFSALSERAIFHAAQSSRTTHAAPEAVDSCRYFAGLLIGALGGHKKEELLSPMFCPVQGLWEREPLAPKITAIAMGSFKEKEPPAIRGSGYVVDSLEAALWAFYKTTDFESGVLAAVNLGDDADTTGAIYGQLAGAHYGIDGILQKWQKKIKMRTLIEQYAEDLFALSGRLK